MILWKYITAIVLQGIMKGLGLQLTNTVGIITYFFKYNRDLKVVTDEKATG